MPPRPTRSSTTPGYEDTDGDGIRECLADQDCPTGDLTFRFNYADDIDTAPREAELLQGMWQEIGVAIQIQGLDPDTLTSVCCPAFEYDIMLWGWGSDPDPAFLLGVALCGRSPPGSARPATATRSTTSSTTRRPVEQDLAARVELIHQMQQILMDDVPYIIPYYSQTIGGLADRHLHRLARGQPDLRARGPFVARRTCDRRSKPMRPGRHADARASLAVTTRRRSEARR